MNHSVLNTVYLAIVFLTLFGSAELLYYKFNFKVEFTRKYVHILTGIITLFFPPMIQNHWLVLILCSSFLIILFLSIRFNLLNSINAVERTTRGSILYPIIVYGCYLMYDFERQLIFYYLPILILAFCDPIAAFVGKRWNYRKINYGGSSKTIGGLLAFFIVAFIITIFSVIKFTGINDNLIFIVSITIALFTAFAEVIASKGYDNLTIPATTILILFIFKKYYFIL